MAHEGYHEPYGDLPESARDVHRAMISLIEELEAVDWYYQRAAVTRDESLKAILLHNAAEETEHAMMALEWLRRADPVFDRNLREYLFREGSIVTAEATSAASKPAESPPRRAPSPRGAGGSRSLGSLRLERREP
jgi:ferritin-like protein